MNNILGVMSVPFPIVPAVHFSPFQQNRVIQTLQRLSIHCIMEGTAEEFASIQHDLSMLCCYSGICHRVSGKGSSEDTPVAESIKTLVKKLVPLPENQELWLQLIIIGHLVQVEAEEGWMPRIETTIPLFIDTSGNTCFGTSILLPISNTPPRKLKIKSSFMDTNDYLEDHDGYFETIRKDPENEEYCQFAGMQDIYVFTNTANGEQFIHIILPAKQDTRRAVILPVTIFPEEHYELESPTALPTMGEINRG